MKLSKTTLSVLKNFASINQSIVIKPGTTLETISNVKDVFAKFNVEETFDKNIAIYDLNEFLGVVSLFEDPEFEFGDDSVIISQGKQKQKYFYADQSIITTPPEKGVSLPSVEVSANLSKEQLGTLIKAAAVNSSSDLTFTNGDVKVHDKTIPNSNSFIIEGVTDTSAQYSLSIGVEKLKVIADDYDVDVCAKGLANFKGASGVEYFIALQPDGQYSE